MQLSTVANRLCNHPAFEQHAAQLQQDAALCDGLVRLLIDAYAAVARQSQKMASEGAELEWPVVVELALALDSEPLRPAAQALACAAAGGDSDATASLDRQLEVSAQLLQLATTAGTADELGAAQLHLAEQLGHAAWRSCLAVRLRQQAARLPNLQPDGRQELQQARFLLPLVPRMARLLEAAHDEAASAAGKAAGAAGAAGNAAGVAGAAGADSSSTADSSAINSEAARLANAFDGLLHHLQLATLCNELGSGTDSGSDADSGSETSVEVWCEVACIAMQALPTLVAVAPLLAGADVDAVGGLAGEICAFAKDAATFAFMLTARSGASTTTGAAQRSLWQLHTTTTRLCHWLAASGLQQLPSLRPRSPHLLSAAAMPLLGAVSMLDMCGAAMTPAQLKRTR